MIDPVFFWIAILCLASLFMSSGLHKFKAPLYYRELIQHYLPMPEQLARLCQRLLAGLEVVLGCLLLIPSAQNAIAMMIVALLVVYFLLIAVSLYRGLEMDCGCAGPLNKIKLSPWLLPRNAVLIIIAWGITRPILDRPIDVVDYCLMIMGSITTIFLYLSFEQLLANHPTLFAIRRK